MTKPTKPVIHARDHEHGGADPVRIVWESTGTGGGGGGAATFALTSGTAFAINGGNTPMVLDGAVASPHFYSSDAGTFDVSSGGRARILQPGMYVVGCQLTFTPPPTDTLTQWVYLFVQFGGSAGGSGDTGYGIEQPWAGPYDDLKGTNQFFPVGGSTSAGTRPDHTHLQRLMPISVTETTDYPLEILPQINTNSSGNIGSASCGLWGWRLGEPLDSYHSD